MPVTVQNPDGRARYRVARDAGHDRSCALAFARSSTLCVLDVCVCPIRARIVRDSAALRLPLPLARLTAAERAEARHRYAVDVLAPVQYGRRDRRPA